MSYRKSLKLNWLNFLDIFVLVHGRQNILEITPEQEEFGIVG
jgi:hypothetical protein